MFNLSVTRYVFVDYEDFNLYSLINTHAYNIGAQNTFKILTCFK